MLFFALSLLTTSAQAEKFHFNPMPMPRDTFPVEGTVSLEEMTAAPYCINPSAGVLTPTACPTGLRDIFSKCEGENYLCQSDDAVVGNVSGVFTTTFQGWPTGYGGFDDVRYARELTVDAEHEYTFMEPELEKDDGILVLSTAQIEKLETECAEHPLFLVIEKVQVGCAMGQFDGDYKDGTLSVKTDVGLGTGHEVGTGAFRSLGASAASCQVTAPVRVVARPLREVCHTVISDQRLSRANVDREESDSNFTVDMEKLEILHNRALEEAKATKERELKALTVKLTAERGVEVKELKTGHREEVDALKADHRKEVETLKGDLKVEKKEAVDEVKADHKVVLAELKTEHQTEVDKTAAELEKVRKEKEKVAADLTRCEARPQPTE